MEYADSKDKNIVAGYWEVFTQNGQSLLSLYSMHEEFTQYNLKGFIPMLIKNTANEVVRIASDPKDKLYRRTTIICN